MYNGIDSCLRNRLSLIVAMDKNRVIGSNGQIPWNLPDDLRIFKNTTIGKAVVMGRRTWESLPERFRPLPQRQNIVLTSSDEYKAQGAMVANSIQDTLSILNTFHYSVIIGGAKVYEAFLPHVQTMYITYVDGIFQGDTYFPDVNWSEWNFLFEKEYSKEKHPNNSHSFIFSVYERRDA